MLEGQIPNNVHTFIFPDKNYKVNIMPYSETGKKAWKEPGILGKGI